ncbi:MAG: hypothetical protein G01um101425_644 [Candidatus Peregrinibacteria bacterium Gr01-1014_25]|nr:MAG: hypothetical protein G01um101425_644 [Candidatus Peregrinibacteria bacterium Gr01-1014_25]
MQLSRSRLATGILIAGLALVVGMFGIEKLTEPLLWIGWMPPWMDGLFGMPVDTWLSVVGVAEIALAVLLIIPVRAVRRVGAALLCAHLLFVAIQVGWNDIGIRDIGLFSAAAALLILL